MPQQTPISPDPREQALLARMPNVPLPVARSLAADIVSGKLKTRGVPVAFERFYAHVAAAGRTPMTAATADFAAATNSRTSHRTFLQALGRHDPSVPLQPARPVSQDWDHWLNSRYNQKPEKPRASTRVMVLPDNWPEAWQAALPLLERPVRRGEIRWRRLAPKTRDAVIQAVGMCAAAHAWAEAEGQPLPYAFSSDLAEAFLRYLLIERGISARSAGDYIDRVRGFAHRGGLFDLQTAEAFADISTALHAEAAEEEPAKPQKVRKFAEAFDLADILRAALRCAEAADALPAHGAKAERLRRKAVVLALLVNGADRQGDLSRFRIGHEIQRLEDGTWELGFRQAKTGQRKEIGALWEITGQILDHHILADRPDWQIRDRLAELDGMNLLSLSTEGFGTYHASALLREEFGISGHLIRTLATNLLRTQHPDAAWAAQAMLGHSSRFMQSHYLTDFRMTAALRDYHKTIGALAQASG